MSCLEMGVGKSHEIAFSMTVQRDFSKSISQELITTHFFTERDTMIQACEA